MAPVRITDDYYDILKVSHLATFDAIKKNYLQLAKILHPDKNLNDSCSTAAFQAVSSASSCPLHCHKDRD